MDIRVKPSRHVSHAVKVSLASACLGLLLAACATTQPMAQDWQGLRPEDAVHKRLALDPRLEGAPISVSLRDGTATLSGEVSSLGQKLVAEQDLYEVQGVFKVSDNLTIRPSQIPDQEIARAIISGVPPYCIEEAPLTKVDVYVKNGNVTLAGQSKSREAKDAIVNVATFTRGVRSLDDRIVVVPRYGQVTAMDELISNGVGQVIKCSAAEGQDIRVDVRNGIVTLSGDLTSTTGIEEMEKAVGRVPGVVQVKDNISVSPAFPVDPTENPTLMAY